jgi:ribosomal protein L11 methyltransferase
LAESRIYPGLNLSWPNSTGVDDDPAGDLVLAELDEFGPMAVEDTAAGRRVFFSTPSDRDAAMAHLGAALPWCQAQAVDVADERWAERSQAALRAVQVGALTSAPPWAVPADRAGLIIIQPSMGFGTGHHASTRLCLRLLQDAPVSGAHVLDAGTGSGVLAIAAHTLGAASVVALDFDPDAVTSARESAELNGVADRVDIRQADLEHDPRVDGEPFSLVLANLTGGMLVRMAERLFQLIAPGGTLIASGVTLDEEEGVTQALTACGGNLQTRLVEAEWTGLRFQVPAAPSSLERA